MTAQLQITGGRHGSLVIPIQPGQLLRIGRTRWADVCLALDPALAPVHFAVEFTGRELRVTDLSDGSGLRGPDGPFHQATLLAGARFQAGQTEFVVELPDDCLVTGVPADASGAIKPDQIWEWRSIPFSKPANRFLGSAGSPREMINSLLATALFADAWLMMTHKIGAIPLVKWLAAEIAGALGTRMPAEDAHHFEAVRQWAQNPGPETLDVVRGEIPEELDSPGAWIAQAVAWTAPNLLPDSLGKVATPPGLCPRACANAVTFLAMATQASLGETQSRFVDAAEQHFCVFGPKSEPAVS